MFEEKNDNIIRIEGQGTDGPLARVYMKKAREKARKCLEEADDFVLITNQKESTNACGYAGSIRGSVGQAIMCMKHVKSLADNLPSSERTAFLKVIDMAVVKMGKENPKDNGK